MDTNAAITPEVESVTDFEFDLAGRVRNLGLPASAANALIPLFEAVSNGLHAIEARWGEISSTSGEITIRVGSVRENAPNLL